MDADLGYGMWDLREQETFERPASRHAMSQQACGKHARVVDDEQIARRQQVRKRRDRRMIDSAGHAVESHEPRAAPLGRRVLRNKF